MIPRRPYAHLVWGPTIALLALYIRFGQPQARFHLIRVLVDSEPFHIAAHSFLYGTLAWLAARRFGERAWLVLGFVLAMGLVQELAQVVGGTRAFGGPELFDLAVDGLAASAVVGATRLTRSLSRRRARSIGA